MRLRPKHPPCRICRFAESTEGVELLVRACDECWRAMKVKSRYSKNFGSNGVTIGATYTPKSQISVADTVWNAYPLKRT
jgi:hypothetical protein